MENKYIITLGKDEIPEVKKIAEKCGFSVSEISEMNNATIVSLDYSDTDGHIVDSSIRFGMELKDYYNSRKEYVIIAYSDEGADDIIELAKQYLFHLIERGKSNHTDIIYLKFRYKGINIFVDAKELGYELGKVNLM